MSDYGDFELYPFDPETETAQPSPPGVQQAEQPSPPSTDPMPQWSNPTAPQPQVAPHAPGPVANLPERERGRFWGVLVAIVGLLLILAVSFSQSSSHNTFDDEDEYVASHAWLPTDYGTLAFEVPDGWEVENSDDQVVVVSLPEGRFAAVVPDRPTIDRANLAKEAARLRDGFKPRGKPTFPQDDVFTSGQSIVQRAKGSFHGEPATETTTLTVKGDRGLVTSLVTADADAQAAVDGEAMVDDLRGAFEQES